MRANRLRLPLATAGLALLAAGALAAEDWAKQRRRMVNEIEMDVVMTSRELGKQTLDRRVLEVVGRVPRHEFVPEQVRPYAYENRPLPIGYGQTISQPYIVAIMTDLLELDSDDAVLEVGTGSAYQAAVLAEIVKKVYTIEIIPELGEQAAERLSQLGYQNVAARVGDGYYGWEEHAPFDAVIVTAAAGHVPPPLIEQLEPGGRMIIPVGGPFTVQHLVLIRKSTEGEVQSRRILPVSFVPLTGRH